MRFPFRKRKVLRVRAQHADLDNAAIEGLWTGMYEGHYHLRAVKTLVAGQDQPFRHDEILIPKNKVVYLEVMGSDSNPNSQVFEVGEPA